MVPGELSSAELAGRTAVVIDVLRAASTIVQALGSGASGIYPVASVEEAIKLANSLGRDDVLLCGEKRCLPIEGFDLGNSPREFTPEVVAGKALVMNTTNGTHALSLAGGAERVLVASFLNLQAVARELAREGADVVVVCAGREGRFTLEDAVCAGVLVDRVEGCADSCEFNDAALAARALAEKFEPGPGMFAGTAAGRMIVEAGLGDDLAVCAEIDRFDLVPVLEDRQIRLLELTSSEV